MATIGGDDPAPCFIIRSGRDPEIMTPPYREASTGRDMMIALCLVLALQTAVSPITPPGSPARELKIDIAFDEAFFDAADRNHDQRLTLAELTAAMEQRIERSFAAHAEATFWFVLPSLPIFLVIPVLLRNGWSFWAALAVGCGLTILLYSLMVSLGPRFGLRL